MKELFLAMLRLIIPEPGNDPAKDYRWRVTIAGWTVANSAGTVLAIALAIGAIPVLSHGFAKADDVITIQQKWTDTQTTNQRRLDDVQANQLDSKIMDTKSRQCGAIKARSLGNKDPNLDTVIRFMTDRLQEELEAYSALARHRYRLPGCEEL